MLVFAVVVAATRFAERSYGPGAVELLVFLLMAWLMSPLVFPVQLAPFKRSADDGRPIVSWRPGCQYCLRLRLRLGRDARLAYWVNIWSDPAGAAAVRAVTGGR